ncbi:threonine ammonia-lyase, biosynthetic [Mycotypha africana]|uniref:threonine ammonia-lyase, biosynthetic n=1 Tax=Mycotypha africana TaxID=64632 RepID=UPI002300018D|nr:threonine ammonia-lyase, biosynthetic [Mycotypha africana]KAI8977301.1 threonine ammonia-lyase, biosynthetic [Mycotypha africana]
MTANELSANSPTADINTASLNPPTKINYPHKPENPDYLRMILTARVYDIIQETPLQEAVNLNTKLNGARIYLKREDLQPVFSFKIRGAYNRLAHLSEEEKKRGVIACSAGNHAQGVALSAQKLGITAKIVMPSPTPAIKWRNVQRLGAKVILHGDDFDEAKKECARLTATEGLINIPPFDDPYVIAGQGTIGMEILRQLDVSKISTIFVPIGGGGLIAGIGVYVKRIAPHVKIVGVETFDACAMDHSLKEKKRILLNEVGLFADGAAVRMVGEETYRLAQEVVDEVVLVNNDEVCAAIKDVFEDTRSVCEPTGALALAATKKYLQLHPEAKDDVHVAIVSGANVNFDRLRFIAERAELGEKTEAFCTVIIPEQPGSFKKMIDQVVPRAVTEFSYRYSDPKEAQIYISFKVMGNKDLKSDVQQVLAAWKEQGMRGIDVSDNELAKCHARYMVGGRSKAGTRPANERVFRFIFPERPGALFRFLVGLDSTWNVSLFHYRNHGDDMGKVFLGVQVPPEDTDQFNSYLISLGYHFEEETDNIVYRSFLC